MLSSDYFQSKLACCYLRDSFNSTLEPIQPWARPWCRVEDPGASAAYAILRHPSGPIGQVSREVGDANSCFRLFWIVQCREHADERILPTAMSTAMGQRTKIRSNSKKGKEKYHAIT